MQTDSLFYEIFQTFPTLFFQLIGESVTLATHYRFDSVEVKQLAFRIDGVFLPNSGLRQQPIHFLEVQFQPDADLYVRLISEIVLYLYKSPLPNDWRATVIFPSQRLEPAIPERYHEFFSSRRVHRIYLDAIPREIVAQSPELGVMCLIIEPEETAPRRARQLLAQAQSPLVPPQAQRDFLELVKSVIIYKYPQKSQQEIATMLGLSDMKKTRVYQEGRQEGRQEGELCLVLRQLIWRMGPLAPEIEAKIQALSLSELEALAEALLDFSDVADLWAWLQRQR